MAAIDALDSLSNDELLQHVLQRCVYCVRRERGSNAEQVMWPHRYRDGCYYVAPDDDHKNKAKTQRVRTLQEALVYVFGQSYRIGVAPESGESPSIKKAGRLSVDSELIGALQAILVDRTFELRAEPDSGLAEFWEGDRELTRRYARNRAARAVCFAHHGYRCAVCDNRFAEFYGPVWIELLEVHHLKPFARSERRRVVDPRRDLVPVCPTCHRFLHRTHPACPLGIEEARMELLWTSATAANPSPTNAASSTSSPSTNA